MTISRVSGPRSTVLGVNTRPELRRPSSTAGCRALTVRKFRLRKESWVNALMKTCGEANLSFTTGRTNFISAASSANPTVTSISSMIRAFLLRATSRPPTWSSNSELECTSVAQQRVNTPRCAALREHFVLLGEWQPDIQQWQRQAGSKAAHVLQLERVILFFSSIIPYKRSSP